MIAIDDNFKISENGGTGNATIFVSATDKNLFSTASTQVEVSTSVGGNIKRYVTLNKKAAHGYMYTPVEWVSNEDIDTRIWIDLGYVWKDNSRAQLGFVIPGTHTKPNGQQVFGEDTVWSSDGNAPLDDNDDLRLFFTKTGSNIGAYWDVGSARVQATVGAITDVWQNWEIGNNYIKNLSNNTNFVTGSTYSISRTGTVGLYGACQYLNTGRTDCVRYSYIKIYEGDTLVRNIIPVLDKDNIPCFFDKVGEQFYYYKVNGVPSTGLTAGNVAYYTSDYIEGDGSDYIDIGYIPVANTYIEMDSQPDGMLSCGSYDDRSYGLYWQRGGDTSDNWGNWRYSNDARQIFFTSLPSTRYTVKFGKQYYINGEQKDSISRSWGNISISVTVFGIHRPSDVTERTAGKLYGLKIYEGNTLVREYIPYKQYGVVGLYEKINGIFYPSNSNTMTQGGNIQPVVEKVVYTESDITISNETPSTAINVGTTFNLNASTTPTGATLSYSSSDTSIATVDNSGVVTAVGKGNATITITAQGFNDDVNKVHYNTTSKTVSVEVQEATPPAWDADFLTIEALNPSTTVTLKNPSNRNIWYRKDNQTEYTKIPTGDTSITLENANGYIKLYGDNKVVGTNKNTAAFNIYCQMNCNCYGKLTSLLSSGCPETISTVYTFSYLFKESSIVDAGGLILPNNVSERCYRQMFLNCTSLTQAPALPATTLAYDCYSSMFKGCTSLTQAPALPAITLEDDCYYRMFYGCTSLTQAPALSATTLKERCYYQMFQNCTSLTQAPALSATTLKERCYFQMFYGCTSLTQAPALSATALAESCYEQMFYGCSSLSTVNLYYAGTAPTADSYSFKNWLKNAGGTGCTIYAPANALWNSSDSEMNIPSNWTVEKTL